MHPRTLLLIALAGTLSAPALAQTIANGSFESGFANWSRADQTGGDGTFNLQTGTTSPVSALAVQPPPDGIRAAMTDAQGPGTHVLYQDFAVPAIVAPGTSIAFSIYLNNTAASYSIPPTGTLDFAATNQTGSQNLNQQARVDILSTGADVLGTTVLQNLYQTTTATPLVAGYSVIQTDLTSFLSAHAGETLRLRFAEVDNVNIFNFGVDDVRFVVPAPGSAGALLGGWVLASRRRRAG